MNKLTKIVSLLFVAVGIICCGSQVVEFDEKSGHVPPVSLSPPTSTPPSTLEGDAGFFEPITDLPCDECLDGGLPLDEQDAGSVVDNDSGSTDNQDAGDQNDSGNSDDADIPPTNDDAGNNPPVVVIDAGDPPTDNDAGNLPQVEDGGNNPPTEDAGNPPSEDAGNPPTNVCNNQTNLTCEKKLHCCMNTCKLLVHVGATEHVECVQACAKAHRLCVFNRLPHHDKVLVCIGKKKN